MNKYCPKCNCETDRYKSGDCKPCAKNRKARYYASNADKLREYSNNYYVANREKVLASVAKYRSENSHKLRETTAKYYAANRDDWKARRNPVAHRINEQNRRKRAAGGNLSPGLAERLFNLQKGRCACCGEKLGDDYHLDHIMPLALGGTNTDDNIQLLRGICNRQKHAKHPVDFMQQRGFLL